ncbi:TrkH family potassium uptake protein [Mitsuokella jalaludinii]|uniref:TrkH family potassium uptake protein n=1 Tax=Mitsuokella jalaludinii TaxID=187979 RepID=UPI003F9AD035
MNYNLICYILGRLVMAEALILIVPLGIALWNGESSRLPFAISMGICFLVSRLLQLRGRSGQGQMTMREGAAITGIGWLLATALGMLPYLLSGSLGLLDGLFESISGFTGTGATVMTSIEAQPLSILFWRMMTHWFGGLGIIVIFIAILPQAGQSTVYMYNAETSGPTQDRVLPRLRDMTKVLFLMYLLFTATACFVYLCCGLPFFDAVTHAMSTIGAGGFSIYDDNAMHFDSPVVEGWMTFFMILSGGNFALYYRAWQKGPRVFRRNTEFKAYLGILLAAMLLITANLVAGFGLEPLTAFRYASFQVGSLSTTGFVSTDFDKWPSFSKGLLLLLMISGGCAGSTAGGVKISRVVLLVKNAWAVVHQKLSPRRVIRASMNGVEVEDDVLVRVEQFFFLYILFIVLWALLLTWDGFGVFDAIGISITTMGCVGPAFGVAGATCTYAEFSDFAKSILCISMLLGRLEMFTLLVMLSPEFWKLHHRW